MSAVKVIPITATYREHYERIFCRDSSNDRASVCSGEDVGLIPTPGSTDSTQDDWERPNAGRSYVSAVPVGALRVGFGEYGEC
jgi:hypothetical protein